MKLHVMTLSWNGEDKLKALASGLMMNLANIPMESVWHIRDNGSTDGSKEFVQSLSSIYPIETKLYSISHNRDSFAKGMNYLFEQANPGDDDLILLLNNDVIFNDDLSLKKMIELQKSTSAEVVGARLLFTGTNSLQHAGVIFGKSYGGMPYHFRPADQSDESSKKNRYFQAVTAAVALVSAKAWREVGGMDQKYQWAFEDVDLFLSIGTRKPKNIVYCGGTNIFHAESASLKKNPVNKLFIGQNVAHFKKKWLGKYKLDHELYLEDNSYNEV